MTSQRIIYQDNFIAVISKDAGEDSETFFQSAFSDKKYVQAVNRLDKPVSGILLLAFSPAIHTKLIYCFKNRQIRKEYWAVCEKPKGNFYENSKTSNTILMQDSKNDYSIQSKKEKDILYSCEDFIIFNNKLQKAFIVENPDRGKKAKLFWSLVKEGINYNFLKIFPVTGRTHQIRVQLSKIGMPIKGDLKYGAKRSEKMGGIRLHSYSISFTHPKTGDRLSFSVFPRNADTLWKTFIAVCSEQ